MAEEQNMLWLISLEVCNKWESFNYWKTIGPVIEYNSGNMLLPQSSMMKFVGDVSGYPAVFVLGFHKGIVNGFLIRGIFFSFLFFSFLFFTKHLF